MTSEKSNSGDIGRIHSPPELPGGGTANAPLNNVSMSDSLIEELASIIVTRS